MLTRASDLVVSGEASDARDASEGLGRANADLILLGSGTGDVSGASQVRELRRQDRVQPILVVGAGAQRELVVDVLAAGATGYVHVDEGCDDLIRAVRSLVDGRTYLSPSLKNLLGTSERGPEPSLLSLSPREREIFHWLARSRSNDDIARSLYISVRTVETHRARILRKLELHSAGELVRFALRKGYVPLEQAC